MQHSSNQNTIDNAIRIGLIALLTALCLYIALPFIGAIGGLIAHGIIGLFVGGVVFVLEYTLFMFWLNERKKFMRIFNYEF